MGTNSRTASTVEAEVVVHVPMNNDTAVCVASVKGLKENWQRWSSERQEYQKHVLSSDADQRLMALQRGQEAYGKPKEGSMTQQRGQDAHRHVSREIQELCEVIRTIGEQRDIDTDGCAGDKKMIVVEFGKLFDHYVAISNKVVGILLRARKQKLVDFEGEMLWQGKDDHVVITLLH